MATVYLAEDVKHQRKVAVKVLRPGLAAALGTDRFLHEIRVAAQLNHPHTLSLYYSGRASVPPLHEVERGPGGEAFLVADVMHFPFERRVVDAVERPVDNGLGVQPSRQNGR